MRKIIRNLISRLYVSKHDYRESRHEIRSSNMNMLTAVSLIVAVMYSVIFIISFIPSVLDIEERRPAFIFLVCYSLVTFIVSTTVLPKRRRFITLILYIFTSVLYSYGLLNGILIHRLSQSVIFFAVQIVCPLLIIDRTSRMLVFSFIWTAVFIALSMILKPRTVAMMDMLDALAFFFVGNLLNMYLSRTRMNEFILRQTIKTERDTDSLTGLLNKGSLTREIKKHLEKDSSKGILIFLDLDDFKQINDTYGHDAGDKVLVSISKVLKETFRQSDVIGRFGGDEFIIFMTNTTDISIAESRAKLALEKMRTSLNEPSISTTVRGSFGISVCSPQNENYSNLLKKADRALYISKGTGKNRVSVSKEV